MEILAEWEEPTELEELAVEEVTSEQDVLLHKKVPTTKQPSPTKEEANEILAACVANSASGWDSLFRRFRFLAYWVASDSDGRFHLPHDVAEDISQETMKATCAAIKCGQVRKNLTCYIRVIAHNKCADYIEKNDRLKPVLRDLRQEAAEKRKPGYTKIPLKYADNDFVAALNECLQNMGNPCATLLAQRYYEEKSYEDIAATASVPSAQVGVRLARCLGKIKKMLEIACPSFCTELAELLG